MKQIITLFFALFLMTNIYAQSDAKKIKGFRSFEWGQELSEMKKDGEAANFIKMEADKDKGGDVFILAGENLMLGNVLLTSVEYVFSKKDNKFFKVILTGKKADTEQMDFIVDYKYGSFKNEDTKDDFVIKQWIVENVTVSLKEFSLHKFELSISSDWEAAEAFRKNTSVSDF